MRTQPGLLTAGVWRSLLGLLAVMVLAVIVGFIWLPSVHPDYARAGWWQALCRAAGVPAEWVPASAAQDPQASRVSSVPDLARTTGGDVGRGGTLALRCTMCHGARGVSGSDIPNLAGQYPEVVYKQLADYKNGQRRHSLMQALAGTLNDQDIRDLSAFYAQLPRPTPNPEHIAVPTLVAVGAPMRNMAPCSACHGGIDQKPGSPWLEGMPAAYLVTQLRGFGSGERRNDAHAMMRNVARQMTQQEVEAVAAYYASRRVPYSASGGGGAR